MSTPNPALVAAAPSLIAVLQAVKTFNASIGSDPAQWPLKVPGALLILQGTVQMQLPALAQAEVGTLQTTINTSVDSEIAKLQALSK